MQIWMNLQNQDATLLRLSALPHQATTKIPGRERNQSTATTRVLNLEAISVVAMPCMNDFRNS